MEPLDRLGIDDEERKHLAELRLNHVRRLRALERQKALSGASVDPKIALEMEDIQAEIDRIDRRLDPPNDPPAPQPEAEDPAVERNYRRQMAEIYREIGFEGIPGLAQRQPITVKEIFVGLQTERPVDSQVDRQLLRLYRQAESTDDKEMIAQLQRLRSRLEHSTASIANAPIDETLRMVNRLVILGDPGSGKTTLLKYLTVVCATEEPESIPPGLLSEDGGVLLPIFVSLGDFSSEASARQQDYSLLDYLHTNARERLMLDLPAHFFEERLDKGQCLVCLDGLDEIWSVKQRKAAGDAVKALVSRFPKSHYVITSRIIGYEEAPLDPRDFVHHTVLPLTDENIRQYIANWYALREADPKRRARYVDKLWKAIQTQPRVRALARNPLLLTIITLVHYSESELPPERVRLYDICVNTLLGVWDERKGVLGDERMVPLRRYRRWLVERLAFELHVRGDQPGRMQMIKAGDLERLLMRFLMEKRQLDLEDDDSAAREIAQAFIQLIRTRTGLLIDRGNGVFAFSHLTFQEYLTACDIENRCMHGGEQALWNTIQTHVRDPHWREVILLLLGNLNKYEDLSTRMIEQILNAGRTAKFDSVFHYHLYLAARALADRVEVTPAMRRRVTRDLLAVARSKVPWQREDAFAALATLTEYADVSRQLLELVSDAELDISIRAEAAKAVGQPGQREEVIDALIGVARDAQTHAWVRRACVLALAPIGRAKERIAGALLDLVRDPLADAEIRRAGILALGQVGRADEAIITVLLEQSRDRTIDPEIRLTIGVMLGQLGRQDEAAEVLLDLANSMRLDAHVRSEAARMLGQFGIVQDAVVKALLTLAIYSRNPTDLRVESIRALGKMGRGDEEVTRKLLYLSNLKKVDVNIRCVAAMALGRGKHAAEAIAALSELGKAELESAQSADTPLFESIVRALRQIGRDPQLDDEVRFDAAAALQELNRIDEMIEVLLEMGRGMHVSTETHARVADALRELAGDWSADTKARYTIADRGAQAKIRYAAADALVQMELTDEASEIFYSLATNRNLDREGGSGERQLAAAALMHVGRPRDAMNSLLEIARTPRINMSVRRASVYSLVELARNQDLDSAIRDATLGSLRELAQNRELEADVRLDAAEALVRLGLAVSALAILVELSRDQQTYGGLRRKAAQSISQLVRDRVITYDVQLAAADALLEIGRGDKAVAALLDLIADSRIDLTARQTAIRWLAKHLTDPSIAEETRIFARTRLRELRPPAAS